MTKAELISSISKGAGIKKKQAEAALQEVINSIAESLKRGERVAIPGLGIFTVKQRAERKGRNPQTGAELLIPARKVISFKPAKELKDSIAGTS
ncbi:MAG: HU family DNA-binding protein [Aquificaceae bacterium]